MREFVDGEGRSWDVVVGRESWGAFFALFIPREDGAEIRQTLLRSVNNEGAHEELHEMDPTELEALFQRSDPKETG